MTQMDLIPQFDGATFDPRLDGDRLISQLERVKALMSDGQWRSLRSIVEVVGGSETGVAARLRGMRKARFGQLAVERRRVAESGLWEYRVITERA